MADSMNLDSADLVGSLDEFEHLENIPGDFDTFTSGHEEIVHSKVILPHNEDTIDMIHDVHPEQIITVDHVDGGMSVVVKEEVVKIEDSEMETERVMDHDEMSMGAIGAEIDLDGSVNMEHIITIKRDGQEDESAQDIFSGEIIEEVVVNDDQNFEDHSDHSEQHPDLKGDSLSSIDHFVEEEVISESLGVSDYDGEDNLLEPISTDVTEPAIEEIVKSEPLTMTSKVASSGVYVVATGNSSNIVSAQSFIPTNTVFTTQKETKTSGGTRLVLPSVETSGPTLRLVSSSQGKMLSSTQARTITLSQARQMGLFTQAKLSTMLPTNILPKPSGSQTQITTQSAVQQITNKVTLPKKGTVAVMKSPTKILPVPSPNSKQPQKLLIRQGTTLKPGTLLTNSSGGQVIRIPANQALGNIHQIHLPGKPVQYVKLVSSSAGTKVQGGLDTQAKTIPVALASSIINSPQTMFKIVPISTNPTASAGQRVLIPATTQGTVSGPTVATVAPSSSNFVVLPSHILQGPTTVSTAGVVTTTGTVVASSPAIVSSTDISVASSTPIATVASMTMASSGAASTSPSVSPTPLSAPTTPPPAKKIKTKEVSPKNDMVRIEPATVTARAESWSGDETSSITTYEANGIRPRKPCNCTKSMCLKLYCDCFANGEFCYQCNCTYCYNNLQHEEERQRAIKSCLERNPTAFRPKIGKSYLSEERRHNKGCNCRRSGCLKNYCECYEAKIPCSKNCKCLGCKNVDSPFVMRREDDPRVMASGTGSGSGSSQAGASNSNTLLRLMRSGEVSTTRQHMQPYHTSIKQAYSLMSNEVVEATCQCLLAQVEDWERDNKPKEDDDGHSDSSTDSSSLDVAQSLILEEFSRCIVQIIECVAKSTSSLHAAATS